MQISPPQMSCQVFGNTQQVELYFSGQATIERSPARNSFGPETFTGDTNVENLRRRIDGKRGYALSAD
jgi:hypothetical protein